MRQQIRRLKAPYKLRVCGSYVTLKHLMLLILTNYLLTNQDYQSHNKPALHVTEYDSTMGLDSCPSVAEKQNTLLSSCVEDHHVITLETYFTCRILKTVMYVMVPSVYKCQEICDDS